MTRWKDQLRRAHEEAATALQTEGHTAGEAAGQQRRPGRQVGSDKLPIESEVAEALRVAPGVDDEAVGVEPQTHRAQVGARV